MPNELNSVTTGGTLPVDAYGSLTSSPNATFNFPQPAVLLPQELTLPYTPLRGVAAVSKPQGFLNAVVGLWQSFLDSLDTQGGHIALLGVGSLFLLASGPGYAKVADMAFGAFLLALKGPPARSA